MRIRWFPAAGIFLSVAVWQVGIDASFSDQGERLFPSAPSPERQLKTDSNAAAIELVGSLPGRFVRYDQDVQDQNIQDQDVQAVVTYEPDNGWLRFFELDGSTLLSIKDTNMQFPPDGPIMVLTAPGVFGSRPAPGTTTYLMTLEAVEIAQFPGFDSRFLPDTKLLVIRDLDGQRSRLIDFAEAETAIFEGWYLGSTAEVAMLEGIYYGPVLGPQDIVTYSETAGRYYLYDFNGTEIASFPGNIDGWVAMPDNQSFLVTEGEQTHRFDRNGVKLATYPGHGVGILPDGQAIFLNFYGESLSRLVRLDGEEIASYTGRFPTLTPDHQRVVTHSLEEYMTRIYTLDGTEIAAISGAFREFSPDGEGIIISSYNQQNPDAQKSGLYTLEGVEIAAYIGEFRALWSDAGIVVTSTSDRSGTGSLFMETHLHSLEGELLATVAGSFSGISPNQEVMAVSSNSSPPVTDLYRIRMGE